MQMHPQDIELLQQTYNGAWMKVQTPFGETATIPITRGTPQGDSMSPSIFNLFINLALRHLMSLGVNFQHNCGIKRNHAAFADDMALVTTSVKDMNVLLAGLHEFSIWSGMDLCVLKCRATGHDFATGQNRPTTSIRYGITAQRPQGDEIPNLKSDVAFKYLGLRVALNGSTREEIKHVQDVMLRSSKLMIKHRYTCAQMNKLITTALHPVFNYSAPLAGWRYANLLELEHTWAVATKRAWKLTDGHPTAQFLLPPEEGWMQLHHPTCLASKHSLNLVQTFYNALDGELASLIRHDWEELCEEWCTNKVPEIQMALMLEDSSDRPVTILTNVLRYTGMAGVSIYWSVLPQCQNPEVKLGKHDTPTLLGLLMPYLTEQLHAIWQGAGDATRNRHLMQALRHLLHLGYSTLQHLQHPGGGWWVNAEMPSAQQEAILTALETAFPSEKRHSVTSEQLFEPRNDPRPRATTLRMFASTKRKPERPPTAHAKRFRQTLMVLPFTRQLPESILPALQPLPVTAEPVSCDIVFGQSKPTIIVTPTGSISDLKGRMKYVEGDSAVWEAESAKIHYWRTRKRWTWDQLVIYAKLEFAHAHDCEEHGFRMVSWPLTRFLSEQEGYDTIIGPSVLETDPTFLHWHSAPDWSSVSTSSFPLILLDAFASVDRTPFLQAIADHPTWAIIADPQRLGPNSLAFLNASGIRPSPLAPADTHKVYRKGWWRSGTKATCIGQKLMIWRKGVDNRIHTYPDPYTLHAPYDLSCDFTEGYIRHTQSGPYFDMYRRSQPRRGLVVWTDGSRRLLPKRGLQVGAGAYSARTSACFSVRIGGEAVSVRGEMGAIAHTLRTAPPNRPLCILTDSLGTLQTIRRWRRRDYAPRACNEIHWDILVDILDAIRLRTAPTTLVWVKAHSGDPGNEAADRYADAGCEDTDAVLWPRETYPIRLFEFASPTLLSPNGWSKSVEDYSRTFMGGHQVHRVRAKNTSDSTSALLMEGQGRELMGAILCHQPPVLSAKNIRDFLQAKGYCFPVGKLLNRNSYGTVSSKCKLCGALMEDYPHMQRGCPKTKDCRQQTHDKIARALLDGIQQLSPLSRVVERPVMGTYDNCPANLATFTPDGIVHDGNNIYIIEVSTTFSADPQKRGMRRGDKHNTYHDVRLFLTRAFPKARVRLHTYVMSIHTEYTQNEWDRLLASHTDDPAKARNVQKACVQKCIEGFGDLAALRRHLMEEQHVSVEDPG